jgi:hypothetical protein
VIVEASQSGVIVVGDEGVEVGVSFGMVEEASMMGGAVLLIRSRVSTDVRSKFGLPGIQP